MSSCKIDNSDRSIKLDDRKKLNSDICICYKGIAFDGCAYFLTIPDLRKIAIFNKKLRRSGMVDVNNKYEYICYDISENCFWATVCGNNNEIYKLDRSFNPLGTITLATPSACISEIQGISYNCTNNNLIVVINGDLMQVEKTGTATSLPTPFLRGERVIKVLSLSPYYVVVVRKDKRDYVKAYSCTSCSRVCTKKIPKHVRILDIVTARRKSSGKILLYACCIKNNKCNYIYELELKHLNANSCNFLHCCNTNNCCCGGNQNVQINAPGNEDTNDQIRRSSISPSLTPYTKNEDNDMSINNSTCPYRD